MCIHNIGAIPLEEESTECLYCAFYPKKGDVVKLHLLFLTSIEILLTPRVRIFFIYKLQSRFGNIKRAECI